jgi:hypothetical protein
LWRKPSKKRSRPPRYLGGYEFGNRFYNRRYKAQ